MGLTLLDTFRTLASFEPPRISLAAAPWEPYVDWAIEQGLAPLAAYNLEYRMGGAGAPDWARDRLLSVYQGSLNDTVMKLVNFKRAVDALEGQRVLALGGLSFAEALYPHVAFRPLLDLKLALRPQDVEAFANFLGESSFRPAPARPLSRARVLSDGRTEVLLYPGLFGGAGEAQDAEVFSRATPMKVYGPSLYRLELEDAVLALCLEFAQSGFEVPMLWFLDLRELVRGDPSLGGAYSRPPSAEAVKERARAFRLERALFAALRAVGRLFPEVEAAAESLCPPLRASTRSWLERWIVAPVCELGKRRVARGGDRLRRWLLGGG